MLEYAEDREVARCGEQPGFALLPLSSWTVRVAILKLADGETRRPEHCARVARPDYREVLAWAEDPDYWIMRPAVSDLAEDAATEESPIVR